MNSQFIIHNVQLPKVRDYSEGKKMRTGVLREAWDEFVCVKQS